MLRQQRIEPAPELNRKSTCAFLKQHWDLIVAANFFTIEVWTLRGLTRFLVLFFIDLETRKVEIAGIASRANGLYHQERNHQGIGNRLIASGLDRRATGLISRRERLSEC